MELLNGPEFKDMRAICQETMTIFGCFFMEDAKCELFVRGVQNHRKQLEKSIKPVPTILTPRVGRNIVPSRLASAIPPHIHDDNHTYEQNPLAKLSATIVGWREVKALTHYGVRCPFHLITLFNLFPHIFALLRIAYTVIGAWNLRIEKWSLQPRGI